MAIDRNISTSIISCRNCLHMSNLSVASSHRCSCCSEYSKWEPMCVPETDYTSCSNKSTLQLPRIKKVLFKNPATIVFWDDNTKTVVKCSENDKFDWEKGLAMAIAKKFFGNEGNYYNEFKKWEPEEEDEPVESAFRHRNCNFFLSSLLGW